MKLTANKYFCKEYIIKTALCLIGVFIIGLGVGMMRYADFGIDPFMCLISGVYLVVFYPLGVSFGTAYLSCCLIFLGVVLIFDRSEIGFGTVIAMTLCGYFSDFGVFLFKMVPVEGAGAFIFRIGVMFLGIILLSIGSGIYFNTRIGVSPYDAAGLLITAKMKNPKMYRWIRMGTDIICVAAGFFMGSIPGAGTIIMAFFTGPLFAFFRLRLYVCGRRLKIITW